MDMRPLWLERGALFYWTQKLQQQMFRLGAHRFVEAKWPERSESLVLLK